MVTPPLIHAMADSVKTESIPCTLASSISGSLDLISLGNAVILSGSLSLAKTLNAKAPVIIGYLPTGYYPANDVGGVGISNYAAAYLVVKTNGQIVLTPAANASASLYISAICWEIA